MAATRTQSDHAEHPAEPLDRATLVDIACGIAAARDLWAAHVRHDDVERHPVRLLATDAYEVWVVGWTPGQGVSLHDHGGSTGVIVVTEGRLTERTRTGAARRLEAGDVTELGPTDVHEVCNEGDEWATSIHVYSPPLAAMAYHLTGDAPAVALEALATNPPVVDARHVTRVLHPSHRRD